MSDFTCKPVYRSFPPNNMLTLPVRLIPAVVLLSFLAGCGSASSPVVGKWEGVDNFGQTIRLEFQADGKLRYELLTGNDVHRKWGTYQTDFAQKPAHLDLKLDDRDPIHTIVEVHDADRLSFENINSSDPRPSQFGQDKLTMTRMKE